jgi:hypothetical protein
VDVPGREQARRCSAAYFNSHTAANPGGEIRDRSCSCRVPALLGVGGPPARLLPGLAAAPNPFASRTS